MKFMKSQLKQIIEEELNNMLKEKHADKTRTNDEEMIFLLKSILSQLKVLNYHMTPAKTSPESGLERAIAGATVKEEKNKRGFGEGTPPKDEWGKKQTIEEEEEAKDNPWAICTASVGRDDKEKYEKCVQSVKKEKGIK